MAPRGFTLPSAKTDSARAARSAFFCDLCQKGYSRMNEFEAHESSYDHQHKKRLKDMKDMQRQVQNSGRKEEKGPLMTIKLGGAATKSSTSGTTATAGAGFKKGAFKNAFGPVDDGSKSMKREDGDAGQDSLFVEKKANVDTHPESDDDDSDITDLEDYYDPRKPTECMPSCPATKP